MVLAQVRELPAAPCVSSCSLIHKPKETYFDAGARVTCRTLRQQLFSPVQIFKNLKIDGLSAGDLPHPASAAVHLDPMLADICKNM